jgi:hypothetical protein
MSRTSKSVYEIAAPKRNVPQHAPGQTTIEECGWKQGNQRQLRQERATTLALTGVGLLMEVRSVVYNSPGADLPRSPNEVVERGLVTPAVIGLKQAELNFFSKLFTASP